MKQHRITFRNIASAYNLAVSVCIEPDQIYEISKFLWIFRTDEIELFKELD